MIILEFNSNKTFATIQPIDDFKKKLLKLEKIG